MSRSAEWYFDFISPFAYLQFKHFHRLPADLEVRLVPVLFAGLLGFAAELDEARPSEEAGAEGDSTGAEPEAAQGEVARSAEAPACSRRMRFKSAISSSILW